MKLLTLLPTAALMLSVPALNAQGPASDARELFKELRKEPTRSIVRNGEHISAVNARYEPCATKKEARYFRVLTRTPVGQYDARITSPDGRILMRGTYADASGQVPHGSFIYYDDAGTVRAKGAYVNGIKTGTWERFDDRGAMLPPKEYTGLDWDGMQVHIGLASVSATLDQNLAVK